MSTSEIVFGLVLVIVLVGLGLGVGWRQIRKGRELRGRVDLDPLERAYLRGQVWRRLACSVLMLIFAGFLVGWFFLLRELAAVAPPDPVEETEHPLVRTITYYWIAALFVLFGLVCLAAADFLATARHGMRSVRLLEQQRRAELEEELSRYRRRRAELN